MAENKTGKPRTLPWKPADKLDARQDLLDLLAMHLLICTEKIPGRGEDCGFEAFTEAAGIIGVFDGCGGLGARACPNIGDRTEAYLASRAVGSAVRSWFCRSCENGGWDTEQLKGMMETTLARCQEHAGDGGLRLKGSLVRPFPSTAAMVVIRKAENALVSRHIWAGDSRTYVLDADGLGQVSVDDIRGEDAMSNLSRDGSLTNLVSADKKFVLHSTDFVLQRPCVLLCATDGCFGYVASPMEFECMLLETLLSAHSVSEWEDLLREEIASRAGDDQTIGIAAFGFDTFARMQHCYRQRLPHLRQTVEAFDAAPPAGQQALWNAYKPNYYRFVSER